MATIKEIQDRAEQLQSLTNAVPIKNRIVDGKVRITYDGQSVVWEPGETKVLPRKVADWLQAHSLYHFNPGDVDNDIPAKSHYKLAILGIGQDESDLTQAAVSGVQELLDRSHMPELTRLDPTTGKPLRAVYINPRGTPVPSLPKHHAYDPRVQAKSEKIVELGADQIAEAAGRTSESEIEQGVREFAKDAAGPAHAE